MLDTTSGSFLVSCPPVFFSLESLLLLLDELVFFDEEFEVPAEISFIPGDCDVFESEIGLAFAPFSLFEVPEEDFIPFVSFSLESLELFADLAFLGDDLGVPVASFLSDD